MSDAMAIAAAAVRSAETRVSAAAAQVVQMTSTPPSAPVAPVIATQPSSYQTVHVAMPAADLVGEIVNLKQAELGFQAGVAVFKAADRMTRRTLDILT